MGSKADASPDADNRKYELDIRLSKGHREIRDNIMAEGRTIWRQGILKIAGDGTGSNGRVPVPSSFGGEVHSVPPPPPPPSLQPSFTQQSQPPTSVVRWERFLHVRSLKVLLVEYDDSTRHVVSALLRNCSYEVSTAATGLEAWKFLEDLTNHIDLILSEVAMPSLSGIGLLSKIMSHRTRKHIPVIMMSSHDSMGIVFKCLSKGAVDFLVKPIRKNELKNLWQHVWRRCHSSSGSGSESGIRAHKSTNSVSGDESNTDSRSNGEDEDSSVRLNTRDGSDDGSGTQSSWTKTAVEVESLHPTSYQDHQSADPHDSTCAQVIHPKTETFCNEWMPIPESKSAHERDFVDDKSLAKVFERKVPTADATLDECFPNEKVDQNNITCSSMDIVNEKPKTDNQKLNLPQESMQITCETSVQATDVIGAIASTIKSQVLSKSSKASNNTPETLGSKEKVVNDETPFPSLEIGLKRLISVGDDVTTSNDRNILRHSDQSAFSRYNVSVASSQIPTTLVGANKNASQSYLGSKNLNVFSRPPPLTEKSETVLAVKGSCRSAFHPAKLQPPGKEVQEKMDGIETGATVVHPNGIRVQVEHHHHHHHHHHIHGMQSPPQLQHPGEQEQYTLKNLVSAVPQCGSSNVFGGQIECNAANYSVNGSVSGSNHGSNFLNGSSAAANTVGLNPEDSGPAGKSGGEDNNGSGGGRSGSGTDHNRNAQREAALNKFRQKRKERCFEKKVRYQSRKKLADQRPRLRGQFVRQNTQEQRDQDDGC